MKSILIAAVVAALPAAAWAQESSKAKAWKGYDRGVRWQKSLDAAKALAAREGKPVLLYQLVGDLDKEGC